MKASLVLSVILITMLICPQNYSEPGFNGTAPGCGASGCHTSQAGIVSVTLLSNFQVRITLSGTTGNVAGELVDVNGNVVAVTNPVNNPFILTAPSAGTYKVNAGYKTPSKKWDSTSVTFGTTGIGDNLIEGTPHSYKLFNNYPNPFNPSTSIQYAISSSQFISLKVFDVLGNEVATLVNEQKPAGVYEIKFNAPGLTSGIYFYKLQAGTFIETKKMILLR